MSCVGVLGGYEVGWHYPLQLAWLRHLPVRSLQPPPMGLRKEIVYRAEDIPIARRLTLQQKFWLVRDTLTGRYWDAFQALVPGHVQQDDWQADSSCVLVGVCMSEGVIGLLAVLVANYPRIPEGALALFSTPSLHDIE